jgi:ubiquinone/menaquinone biosynthesis C-methylase UbiE
MTRQFSERCESLIAMDYSWESLLACKAKLDSAGVQNVDLVQADICRLPFRSESFDRAVSCQVLEHVPTAESRAAAIDELSRILKKGGNLALSAYQYSLLMRLFGEKEGHHAGGIYFYRFTRDEFRRLLSRSFQVDSITGALVYHYIARCQKGES